MQSSSLAPRTGLENRPGKGEMMQKMKTVFVIDRNNDSLATREPVASSAWVLDGQGSATIKFDGSACRVNHGKLYRRMDRKLTKNFARQKNHPDFVIEPHMFKAAPEGWEACEVMPDLKTGHWPGWVPVDARNPGDRYHLEAFSEQNELSDGTYELVGPRIQSNRYALETHQLWRHGSVIVEVPRDFDGLKAWLEVNSEEGLVFHHPDGRMAKLRRKDFGISW